MCRSDIDVGSAIELFEDPGCYVFVVLENFLKIAKKLGRRDCNIGMVVNNNLAKIISSHSPLLLEAIIKLVEVKNPDGY